MRARRAQRGVALMLLLAVLVMGAAWYLVRRLDTIAGDYTAASRAYNAQVLARAKQAIIGYVAMQASLAGENNPGALPCPEAPASFNSSSGTDGRMASNCTLPVVGRFPWRSIGTDKLVDAAGEPLWYVISTGWAYNGSNTIINSNSLGQLNVDGSAGSDADTVVALIIAPGPPVSVTASAGCAAWTQTRPTAAPPDLRNYLECENATSPADASFVTKQSNSAFNDQLVRVTKADIMPAIEAAIAHRIEREVVSPLKTALTSSSSSTCSCPAAGACSQATWTCSTAGATPIYSFASAFTDPSTSAMQGAAATYRGLLPLNYAETAALSGTACSPVTGRCNPTFVAWSGTPTLSGPSIYSPSCTATTADQVTCTFNWRCTLLTTCLGGPSTVSFTLNATAANLGMALRQINIGVTMTTVDTPSRSASVVLDSSGSGTVTLTGTTTVSNSGSLLNNALCGIGGLLSLVFGCSQAEIRVPILLFADRSFLHSETDVTYGWLLRNKWHELLYYAVARGYSPYVLPNPPSCGAGNAECLSVANVVPSGQDRALLVLAGRSINGVARPSSALADYVEFGNASGAFERQSPTLFAANPYADAGAANLYDIPASSVAIGVPLYFKAANANTGASTLTTVGTGTQNLRNADGSALAAAAVSANAVVQVTYDGTEFLLGKRPFNDRIIILDCSNPGASLLPCDSR